MNDLREKLYITALNNMHKKLNFARLLNALDRKEITDEDFEKTLTENENDYIIKIDEVATEENVTEIYNIINNLNFIDQNNASIDDISEMFSINFSQFKNKSTE